MVGVDARSRRRRVLAGTLAPSPSRSASLCVRAEQGAVDIEIRETAEDNFVEAIRLKARPEQEALAAPYVANIAQSKFHTLFERYGIHDGETMVGLAACGMNPVGRTVRIARHAAGAQFQREGHGRGGLRRLVEHLQRVHAAPAVFLCSTKQPDSGLRSASRGTESRSAGRSAPTASAFRLRHSG